MFVAQGIVGGHTSVSYLGQGKEQVYVKASRMGDSTKGYIYM